MTDQNASPESGRPYITLTLTEDQAEHVLDGLLARASRAMEILARDLEMLGDKPRENVCDTLADIRIVQSHLDLIGRMCEDHLDKQPKVVVGLGEPGQS